MTASHARACAFLTDLRTKLEDAALAPIVPVHQLKTVWNQYCIVDDIAAEVLPKCVYQGTQQGLAHLRADMVVLGFGEQDLVEKPVVEEEANIPARSRNNTRPVKRGWAGRAGIAARKEGHGSQSKDAHHSQPHVSVGHNIRLNVALGGVATTGQLPDLHSKGSVTERAAEKRPMTIDGLPNIHAKDWQSEPPVRGQVLDIWSEVSNTFRSDRFRQQICSVTGVDMRTCQDLIDSVFAEVLVKHGYECSEKMYLWNLYPHDAEIQSSKQALRDLLEDIRAALSCARPGQQQLH
jgi:hypothetical protein